MGRPRKNPEGANPAEGEQERTNPGENVKVRFKNIWSADIGYFAPGAEAELTEDIALSLADENVVEIL